MNADKAHEIGEMIIGSMVGISTDEYTYKRANQVVVMNEKNSVRVTGEVVTLYPHLMFQRLTAVADRCTEDKTRRKRILSI